MAFISVRKSICWGNGPREEPTSTLVLTSPRRHFVDIRIIWRETEAPTPPAARIAVSEHFSGLDWAFSGTSTMVPLPGEGAGTAGEWRHWIDSRTAAAPADTVVDKGLCFEQPDGTTREVGSMPHPDSAAVTEYEEVWLDMAPQAPEAPATPATRTRRPRCVVLRLGDDAPGGSDGPVGLVVCLGRLCQGLVRTAADSVTAERWQWVGTAREEGGGDAVCGWKCVYRHGTGRLPIPEMLSAESVAGAGLREGTQVSDSTGHAWTVVEAEDADA